MSNCDMSKDLSLSNKHVELAHDMSNESHTALIYWYNIAYCLLNEQYVDKWTYLKLEEEKKLRI